MQSLLSHPKRRCGTAFRAANRDQMVPKSAIQGTFFKPCWDLKSISIPGYFSRSRRRGHQILVLEADLEAGTCLISPSRQSAKACHSTLCCPETLTNAPKFLKSDHLTRLGSKEKDYILLHEFFITFQLYCQLHNGFQGRNRRREHVAFATHPGLCLQLILGVVFGHLPRGQFFSISQAGPGTYL